MTKQFVLKIDLGNEAMKDFLDLGIAVEAVASLLKKKAAWGVPEHIGDDEGKVRDTNGNTVGGWELTEKRSVRFTVDDIEYGTFVRWAKNTEQWKELHRNVTSDFEGEYAKFKEQIRDGDEKPTARYLSLEILSTLTHEIVSLRRKIANLCSSIER